MLMSNFLKNRESTREFKRRNINGKDLETLSEEIKKIRKDSKDKGVDFKLFKNGKLIQKGFKGKGGYSGSMIESPHYILLLSDDNDESKIYASYYMEKLITSINNLDIGTCWVTIDGINPEIKKEVLGEEGEKVDYILALGYQKPRNPFFKKEVFSERKSVEDIVYKDEIGRKIKTEELEERALLDLFYYVRFAPSVKNKQPWRFVVKDNLVDLYMKKDEYNPLDAGIIMYYFEEMLKLIGIDGSWRIKLKENKDFIEIGEINI